MGIEIGAARPHSAGERVFQVIGEEARGLGFSDRLRLFGVMKDPAARFDLLPPHLRKIFDRAAERLGIEL